MSEGSGKAVGEGLGLGLLAALAAALPAATRVPGLRSFIVLWASAALLVGPIAVGVRLARTQPKSLQSAGLGAILAAPLLIAFGGVLKTSTHHRPLGAVTFALAACVVLLGAVAIGARGLDLAREAESSRIRSLARISLILATAGSVIAMLLSALRAAGDESVRSLLLDAALLVAAVAVAALLKVPAVVGRTVHHASAVGWLALVALGVVIGRSAELAESIAPKAPLLGWLAGF